MALIKLLILLHPNVVQDCITLAKEWEKKLESILRLWRSFLQRQQHLGEWLDTAQTVIDDREDDTESLIRKHKVKYFSQQMACCFFNY